MKSEMYLNSNSSIYHHLPTLQTLVYATEAQMVLEIGVNEGNSTKAFLMALEKTGGTLISLDIEPLNESLKKIKNQKWLFIQKDSIAKPEINLCGDHLDILFIDSNHTYQQLKQELEIYEKLVRKNGFIVLHDINQTANLEMYPAYTEFLESHPNYRTAYYYHSQGLAVIQKL